jgi:hypothetical protein
VVSALIAREGRTWLQLSSPRLDVADRAANDQLTPTLNSNIVDDDIIITPDASMI